VAVRAADERTRGLDLSLVENMAREDLDPVEEAKAFRRLIDVGLTRRGVAERLSVSRRLVTERLQLLELDEALHPRLADGTIPPGAVRPLARLAAIHPGLPAVAVARVLAAPRDGWQPPTTWADLVRDPVAAVAADGEEEDGLPADVYQSGERYPVARFTLDADGRKRLEELCGLIGCEPERFHVRFEEDELEQGRALGAVHSSGEGWVHLIVGQQVADQLERAVLHRARGACALVA
jgi:ParB-like chromosome segregation protein Spo0J